MIYIYSDNTKNKSTTIDFPHYLMGLVSVIITADGNVLKSELNYVKRFLNKNFSPQKAIVYLSLLNKYSKKKISTTKICKELNDELNVSSKVQLMHFLIGAAIADRLLSQNETRIIQNIARELRIPPTTIRSILAMYSYESESSQKQQTQQKRVKRSRLTLATAYDILEISSSVTDQEVKKSYRKLVRLYHPDKVIKMGEEFRQGAEEKFLKVQESYELIKSRRGFK